MSQPPPTVSLTSLQQPFHHPCLGLLLRVFSTASPWEVFLVQWNNRLWSLYPFTDNLSIMLHCFFPCTSDSKTCLLSSVKAILLFHAHSWTMLTVHKVYLLVFKEISLLLFLQHWSPSLALLSNIPVLGAKFHILLCSSSVSEAFSFFQILLIFLQCF